MRRSHSSSVHSSGTSSSSIARPLRRAASVRSAGPGASTSGWVQTSGIQITPSNRGLRRQNSRTALELHISSDSSSDDIECVTMFSRKRPATSTQESSQTTQPVVLDTDDDDDIDFVDTRRPKATGSKARIATARPAGTPKRARTQSRNSQDILSSPSLLRHSSPTIRRFNSSQAIVLAGDSQDPGCDGAAPGTGADSNCLSGATMVGSIPQNSVLDDEGIPESPLPASPEYRIPETPPRMHVPPPLLGLAAKQRSANIELPNDPISEFVSQREGSPGLAPASPEHADTYAGNTSITQWYHDNLTKDDSADDGLGLGCPSDADSLAHEEPAQATGEQASDDGYSSPLEGFWDLRRNGQDGGSDRDMYIHQFESSVRSKPPSQGKASQLAVRAPPPPLPPALPPRPVQRGRKTAAYPGWHQNNAVRPLVSSRPPQTAATRTPAWRRGNAVRPLSSSYLAQKPAVRPPAMPHYNYYADDPFLDVGGSLNWEGGGMSRFG